MSYDSGRGAKTAAAPAKVKTIEDVIACELEGPHEVHPTTWPPQANGINTAMPDMSLQCVKCGCWLVVYDWHATSEHSRVKVVLPKR